LTLDRDFLFNRTDRNQRVSAAQSVHLVAATVGFISFFLLWLAVVWGMVLRNGWALTRIRHATVYGFHMTVALLGLCLAAVHAFAQLAVPDGPVHLVDTLLPFVNSTDPIGIGVGVISLELMAAAALSVLIQKRLGYTRWRALHSLTYVAFMLLVAHVLISGSDVTPTYVWGSVLGAWLVTVALWLTTTSWLRDLRRDRSEKTAARQRGQEISVNVDAQRCARFGFCEHEAPDVFRLRSDGRLSYRGTVPAESLDAAIRAVEVCPARAIALTAPPSSVLTPRRAEPPAGTPAPGPDPRFGGAPADGDARAARPGRIGRGGRGGRGAVPGRGAPDRGGAGLDLTPLPGGFAPPERIDDTGTFQRLDRLRHTGEFRRPDSYDGPEPFDGPDRFDRPDRPDRLDGPGGRYDGTDQFGGPANGSGRPAGYGDLTGETFDDGDDSTGGTVLGTHRWGTARRGGGL
jgi:sulfoxide reductase heme-binding subunit YedZ